MFYLALAKSNISRVVDQMNSMCALIIGVKCSIRLK